jgi:hypothetical protein
MENDAETITFLQFKLREVEKVTKRQEDETASLTRQRDALFRKITEDFENASKVARKKLRLGRKKEKRRDSLDRVQKEASEQTRLRTDKRIAELRLKQITRDANEAGQLPE